MAKKIIRNVIVDEPTSEDLFHGKGHDRTAMSLVEAIRSFNDEDRAIGLDGAWGSGKSSVVEIAERHLEETRNSKDVRYFFFTFDIWKSQGAGFRRSFLEHFVTWAKEKFPQKHSKLEEIEKGIHGKTREIETNNQPVLGWFGIGVLFFLPLLPIYYFWAKSVYDVLNEAGDRIQFLYSWPFIIFLVFASAAMITAQRKRRAGGDKMDFKTALSSVLLISSRQHQDHKVTQKVREIDPNDYEFHNTFREILSLIQSRNAKVVLVLDNIDRLPKREIKEYWALVRSIFSRTHQSTKIGPEKTITAIVPYDRTLVESNVSEEDSVGEAAGRQRLTKLSSRELFSKTFDEVLMVAPPVLSNAREFFSQKLDIALPDRVSKDHRFRTYRIFCELLREEGGTTTPRKVVSFVNDLSGLFVLHEGRYPLPTVAAYLAHQDLISSDPNKLNDLSNLNYKIVALASDAELPKHLAAMVFNVDAELAFQVLLDDVIARAVISDSPDELEHLSVASGFDLRVDDVLRTNLDEWHGTGDYRKAIGNFAKVLPSYKGDAKPHLIGALVDGFEAVDRFGINREEYGPYLDLFELADEKYRQQILRRYLEAAFSGIKSAQEATYDLGERFADFLSYSSQRLEKFGLGSTLHAELRRFKLNTSPDFLFGLGVNIAEAGFGFSEFQSVEIILPDEGDYFAEIATDSPSVAMLALVQFKQARMLSDENWIAVADACLEACKAADQEPDRTADLLEVACFSWRSLPEGRRSEVTLSAAFSNGQFFRNLGLGEAESSERAIANAFFLVGQTGLGEALDSPTKLHANGQQRVPDGSDEFAAFNEIVQGSSPLTVSQAVNVATKAKHAVKVADPWIKFGQANPDHQAVEQVVRQVFSFDDPPRLNVSALKRYFVYLHGILGGEAFIDVLSRIDSRISFDQIAETDLKSVPQGFLIVTQKANGENWHLFHDHISAKLREISSADWHKHIQAMDHTAKILVEKLTTSGCSLDSAKFREPLIQLILDVLSGAVTPSAEDGSIDTLVTALDESYRADLWRTLREKIADVTPSSLDNAVHLFLNLLSDLVQRGDRIMAGEKDNVVRHVLCPALEGRNRAVLKIFVEMGYTRVSDYTKSSNESTTKRLDGAMKHFSETEEDRVWVRAVTEAIIGKRRTKSIWDIWFGTGE